MSLINVQTVNQENIYYLKIIQILEKKYGIHPLFNQNGQISFKRRNINSQNAYQYLYCKCVKKLKVRERNQLNLLFLLYSAELLHTVVDLNRELGQAPIRRLIDVPKYRDALNKVSDKLSDKFLNYKNLREQFIKERCIVTKTLNNTQFLKGVFTYKDYGLIDYYNGIIILANLNVNEIGPLLIENNIEVFSTNNHGYYGITNHTKNNEGYVEVYDFKRKNTQFKLWRGTKNPKINRLYYQFNNSQQYLPIIVDKLPVKFVPTTSKNHFKHPLNEY